jgi:hypothetical protein
MRGDPKVEVTYRNKTIRAIAREAGDDQSQAICRDSAFSRCDFQQ